MRPDRFIREMDKLFPNRNDPCPHLGNGMSLKDAIIECDLEDLQVELADFYDSAYAQCSGREDYDEFY